jgi:sugar/nucleoside kinase (ribokinase family)
VHHGPVAEAEARPAAPHDLPDARPILVVGSIAYDDVRTPFEARSGVLGGAAAYFSLAAAVYAPVRLVGVVGDDFSEDDVRRLGAKRVDLGGLERRAGRSFRWSGAYDYEMSAAETLSTDLGVFADWHPAVPHAFRDTQFVFLANIDPEVQLAVLEQVERPHMVALDTMNFWIEHRREALGRVIERVDVVCINEGEVRQLCGTPNVLRAARDLLRRGPRAVVVKRGEHGATLFTAEGMFWAPAYPLEQVRDPTGAGDAFAGGLLGQLASADRLDATELRRAVLHGAVAASFAVETFSVDGIEAATREAVRERYRTLRELVAVGVEAADPDPFGRR